MSDPRPTTLLHDNWGESRPATDEELAEVARMDWRRRFLSLVVLMFVMAGVTAFVGWMLIRMPIYP